MTRSCAWLALAVLAVAAVEARAQDARAGSGSGDALHLSAQVLDLAPGGGGVTGSVDWVHALSARHGLNLGVASFDLAGTRWSYGRVGGTLRPAARAVLHAEADVGRGSEAGRGFPYTSARLSLAYEAVPRALLLEIENHYVAIDRTRGNVVKLAASVLPAPTLALNVAVHGTTAGDVDSRTLTLRADSEHRGLAVFAGVAFGRSRPALVGLSASGAAQSLRQVFGGVTVPLGRNRLGLALDHLALGAASRRSLLVSWRVPL